MERMIGLSKADIRKDPKIHESAIRLSFKVEEFPSATVYFASGSNLLDLICLLRDNDIRFKVMGDEEEVRARYAS